jgi:cob(I)alamin adenosyltransferase
LGRERVPKYADRPEACGTVDEASAALGMARGLAKDKQVRTLLLAVQRDLYKLMADLATLPETATRPPWLGDERLAWLEQKTDALGKRVDMPPAFIVPGDSVGGAWLDIGRTIVRRAAPATPQVVQERAHRPPTAPRAGQR